MEKSIRLKLIKDAGFEHDIEVKAALSLAIKAHCKQI
jgi:hypothetical protein